MLMCNCMKPSRQSKVTILKSELIRIMVVGDQMSGKTSLVQKYVNDTWPKHHQFTIGVNCEIKPITKEGKDIRLHIFDTGIYISNDLIRNLVSGYEIRFIVLCIDLSDTKQSIQVIREWERRLEELENFDNCKILVCGTKADIKNPQVKTSHDSVMSKSSKVINYFETSSKTGQNIIEIFEFIVDFHWVNRLSTVPDKFLNES